MKRFGFGGTALGQCLHQRLLGNDVIRHEVILIGTVRLNELEAGRAAL